MRQEIMSVGVYGANCNILWDDPACAWVVDPGARGAAILGRLKNLNLRPGLVVLTHGHFDHISAVNDIVAEFPVPVYMHAADEEMAFSPLNAMPPYPATSRPSTLITDKVDGDRIACGGLEARIIHTPGHTPGGWCLLFEKDNLLVAGDTLFAGSVGRTDFPGGNSRHLSASLQKLKVLPLETQVICGHGPMTTIERELRDNPYL